MFISLSLISPIAPLRFITRAIFIESLRAIAACISLIYASLAPILWRNWLILEACEPESTERSLRWFTISWLVLFWSFNRSLNALIIAAYTLAESAQSWCHFFSWL